MTSPKKSNFPFYILLTLILLGLSPILKAQFTVDWTGIVDDEPQSSAIAKGCAPSSVKFPPIINGAIYNEQHPEWGKYSFSWTVTPSAAPSSALDYSKIVDNPGTYSVSVVVSNGTDEVSKSKSNYLILDKAPSVDFSADVTQGCSPIEAINFKDESTSESGAIVKWRWGFNGCDITDSDQKNPSPTALACGFHDIYLQVTTDTKCKASITKKDFLEVVCIDTSFFVLPSFTCEAPLTAKATANEFRPEFKFKWTSIGGTMSADDNKEADITYNSDGAYDISLNISGMFANCNVTITRKNAIEVGSPQPTFTMPDTLCINNCYFPGNVDVEAPIYKWCVVNVNSGDTLLCRGGKRPPICIKEPGKHKVILYVTDGKGCRKSLVKEVWVNNPISDFVFNQQFPSNMVCNYPFDLNFTNTSTSNDVFAGANLTYAWQIPLNYDYGQIKNQLDLKGTDADTTDKNIKVEVLDIYGVAANDIEMDITLLITDGYGCKSSKTKAVSLLLIEPGVTVADNGGCAPKAVCLVNSVKSSDPMSQVIWDLDTLLAPFPVTSSDDTTCVNISTHGNFVVFMNWESIKGCRRTFRGEVKMGAKTTPVANIFPYSACAGGDDDGNTFFDGSGSYVDLDGVNRFDLVNTFYWIRGKYEPSSGSCLKSEKDLGGKTQQVIHERDTGCFCVKLTTGYNACFDSIIIPDAYCKAAPIIGPIKTDYKCGDASAIFYLDTVVSADSIVWYVDGIGAIPAMDATKRSAEFTPTGGDGEYRIVCKAWTDTCNYEVSYNLTIVTDFEFTEEIEANYDCKGKYRVYTFPQDKEHVQDSIKWYVRKVGEDFPIDSSTILSFKSYAFVENGDYSVTLEVYVGSCVITETKEFTLSEPNVSVTVKSGALYTCINEPIQLSGVDNSSVTPITKWTWSYLETNENCNPTNGVNNGINLAPICFNKAGEYLVTLTVRDAKSCKKRIITRIFAQDVDSSFFANTINFCEGDSLKAVPTGNISSPANHWWKVNDVLVHADTTNLTDSTLSVKVDFNDLAFANGKGRNIELKLVKEIAGVCRDSLIQLINIDPQPIADFASIYSSACTDNSICFTANTTLFDTSGCLWDWEFPNGIADRDDGPIGCTLYPTTGVYDVCLDIKTELGCFDEICKIGVIETKIMTGDLTITTPKEICISDQICLEIINASGIDQISWDIEGSPVITTAVNDPTPSICILPKKVGTLSIKALLESEGCDKILLQDSIIVKELKSDFNFSNDSLCGPGEVTITSTSFGADEIEWFINGVSEGSESILPSKTYPIGQHIVELEAKNEDCVHLYADTLHVFAKPVITTSKAKIELCQNEKDSVYITGGKNYEWFPLSGLTPLPSNANEAAMEINPEGSISYSIHITDKNKCTADVEIEVISDSTELSIMLNDSVYCGEIVLDNIQNNSSGSFFNWFVNGSLVSDEFLSNWTIDAPGDYKIAFSVYDKFNKCQKQKEAILTLKRQPVINLFDTDTVCKGETIVLTSEQNGTPSWKILTANASITAPTGFNPTIRPEKTIALRLTVLGPNGCSNDEVVEVIVDYSRSTLLLATDSICVFEEVYVSNFSVGNSWNWELGATANPKKSSAEKPTWFYNEPGIYTVELRARNQSDKCATTATEKIQVFPLPELSLADEFRICYGERIILNANSNGSKFVWVPGKFLSDSAALKPLSSPEETIEYKIIARTSFGCITSDSAIVIVSQPFTVSHISDTTLRIGEEFASDLQPSRNGLVYTIEPILDVSCSDCPTPTFTALDTTCYFITVQDNAGCFRDEFEFCVNVDQDETVDIASAFTPNNDGLNDYLMVQGKGMKKLIRFDVFNRWGELVFHSEDLEDGWNGTYKGKKQGDETFVYQLEVEMFSGERLSKTGRVTLFW